MCSGAGYKIEAHAWLSPCQYDDRPFLPASMGSGILVGKEYRNQVGPSPKSNGPLSRMS